MTYEIYKRSVEIECADIRGMSSMSIKDYRQYVDDHLLRVDHHDALLSEIGGFPLATNKVQLDALIKALEALRHKVGKDNLP